MEVIYEDRRNQLWVGGYGGLVKRSGEGFEPVPASEELRSQTWPWRFQAWMVLAAGTRRSDLQL
jgi:hypothetical protein